MLSRWLLYVGILTVLAIGAIVYMQLDSSTASVHAHSTAVSAIIFSPDCRFIASAGQDQLVKVWDAGTLALRRTVGGPKGVCESLSFCDDGSLLAVAGSDGSVKVWHTDTGRLARTILAPDITNASPVHAVRFVPRSRQLLTAGANQYIRLWNVDSGSLLTAVNSINDALPFSQPQEGTRKPREIVSLDISTDGCSLGAIDERGAAIVWDLTSKTTIWAHESTSIDWPGYSLALCEGGQVAATNTDDLQSISLWRLAEHRLDAVLSASAGHWMSRSLPLVYQITSAKHGCFLASAGTDNRISIWDVRTRRLERVITSIRQPVISLRADGHILAAGDYGGKLRLWRLVNDDEPESAARSNTGRN